MTRSIKCIQMQVLQIIWKSLAINLFLSSYSINTSAQNSSYNTNTIPINGTQCTAFGTNALRFNSTGGANTASGYGSLYTNTTGNYNTASGFESLYFNTTGPANTANGTYSLYKNTIGSSNTGIGYQSLFSNTNGSANSALGFASLGNNISGNYNSAYGNSSLINNLTGNGNSAYGCQSLQSNSIGNNNTALGDSAGYFSTGNKNVFLGNYAGYFETSGSNKLYLANDSAKTMIYGDFSTGQVLFGKAKPAGYTFKGNRTLNVFGGIISDSVRVALNISWADYVFGSNYTLKPLQELRTYIDINNHLPNIPSAEEVKINGIEIAAMDAKLLEKIEELYLYIFQQQKQIDELKRMIQEKK